MNTENSKTSEPHRFKLDLTGKFNLKNSNKKNDTFDLPDGSSSIEDIQDFLNLSLKSIKL